eukprot:4159423-Amphidinium_carterae.1
MGIMHIAHILCLGLGHPARTFVDQLGDTKNAPLPSLYRHTQNASGPLLAPHGEHHLGCSKLRNYIFQMSWLSSLRLFACQPGAKLNPSKTSVPNLAGSATRGPYMFSVSFQFIDRIWNQSSNQQKDVKEIV